MYKRQDFAGEPGGGVPQLLRGVGTHPHQRVRIQDGDEGKQLSDLHNTSVIIGTVSCWHICRLVGIDVPITIAAVSYTHL